MTITMNTRIFQSDLTSGPELATEELQEHVDLGLLTKIDNHKEHFAIPPFWIQDLSSGLLNEINKTVLGRWNNKLNGYVVAVKNIRNYDNSAGMNEDHRWLHVDISATYYTFSPQEGQRVKGKITKVGNRAAICIIFDVFTVTVLARDESELGTWNAGDDLRFEIISYVHRRKGPIIKAKSLASFAKNKKRKFPALVANEMEFEEPVEITTNGVDDSFNQSGDLEDSRSSRKEKKKKKKTKIKQEVDDSYEYNEPQNNIPWGQEDVTGNEDHDSTVQPNNEESHSRKKKKKKKSSHGDD